MRQADFSRPGELAVQCLEWSAERNAVSVPEIDQEHQEIFVLGNNLYRALEGGALLNALEPQLLELAAHVTEHFALEEKMMRSRRYSAYAWHKAQHDTVRARLAGLEKSVKADDREAVMSTIDFITAWLQTHTAVSDRMMGAYLRTQDLSRSRYPHVPASIRARK